MKEGKLCIKLLSDLCVSDGGVYNSALDTDICQDEYGIPYIPAKRLRGCLREAATELSDWNADIDPDALFGKEGNSIAKVFIGNAYPENYKFMIGAIKGVQNKIYHKQNILSHFSYIRTQTAINYDTGVADDTSLRTMRVANKGLVFEAPIQYEEELKGQLIRCAGILRHMGIARTRGLGEVEVHFSDEVISYEQAAPHAEYVEGSTKLEYTISLIDPVVFKSVNGGEANTHDYIEGSRTLGIIAEYLKEKKMDYQSFIEQGNLQVSHAYVCVNGMRYTETPAAYYSIKNDSSQFRNKLYDNEEHRKEDMNLQLNSMKHGYVYLDVKTGMLDRASVRVEERYHHRRPEDKSKGRADSKADPKSVFYQISSICSDQKFKGFITGSADQIKTVYECLTSKDEFRMGAGRSSEYGRVQIQVDKVSKISEPRNTETKMLAVKLVSPAIVYNKKAFYSVDSNDLVEEVGKLFNIDPSEADTDIKKYVKYVTLGGWNVTWGRRKPVIQAFDKGSVIVFKFNESRIITIPGSLVIGERKIEGFGELEYIEVGDEDGYKGLLKGNADTAGEDIVDVQSSDFAEAISKDVFLRFMRSEASVKAAEYFKKSDSNKKATVSDLTLMLKELKYESGESVIAKMKEIANDRYDVSDQGKSAKGDIASAILNNADKCCQLLPDLFMREYYVKGFSFDNNELEKEFLQAYLTFGKYIMHKNDGKVSGEEVEANV